MPQATKRGPQSRSKRQNLESGRNPEDQGPDVMDINDVDKGADDDDGEETSHSQSNAEGQSQNLERVRLQLTDVQKALGMAANPGKGKDTWPKDMEKRVGESEDRLKAQLRNGIKERETSQAEFYAKFLHILIRAVSQQDPGVQPDEVTGTENNHLANFEKTNHHPMFGQTQSVLRKSKGLLEDYDALVQHTARQEETVDIAAKFREDNARLVRAIKVGEHAVKAQTGGLLSEESRGYANTAIEASEDTLADSYAIMSAGRKQLHITEERRSEWGEIATEAFKASKVLGRVVNG